MQMFEEILFWINYDVAGPSAQAISSLVMLAISVALSYAAGLLLKKKDDNLFKDDKPTTLCKRGAFIAWHLGRRRLAPLIAWAGGRHTRKETIHGGKGGSKKKQRVFFESGWHPICVGPCNALQRIYQNGEILFEGPITSDSHPSGSSVSIGREGTFVIYWGEEDQPINTYLGHADRVTVSSRWPCLCYIVWTAKRLGTSANWPMLEYVIERRQTNSILSDSDGWHEATETLGAITYTIATAVDGIGMGSGYFMVWGDHSAEFINGKQFQVYGAGCPDGDYRVFKTRISAIDVNPDPDINDNEPVTYIYPYRGMSGTTGSGFLRPFTTDYDNGINPAHALAEVLFTEWPWGLNLSQSHWNIDSLEDLGVLSSDQTGGEDLWTSWITLNGDKCSEMLAHSFQDLGLLLPRDTSDGKLKFVSIRKPSGTLLAISQDMLLDPLPTHEVNLGELPVDQLIFEFPDQAINWRKMTIMIDEDGHAISNDHPKAKTVPITIVDHFTIAGRIAERRSQEMLASGVSYTINTNRWARSLLPGDAITAHDFEETLRIISVKFDANTGKVEIQCIPDFYGAAISDFLPTRGGGMFSAEPTKGDLYGVVEVPETLLAGSTDISILVPRIRAHNQISEAEVHISADDVTYTDKEPQVDVHTGGTLLDALTADTLTIVAQGPTFTVFGPDIGDTLDLSADLTGWRAGRQLVSINGEIFFLQKVTAISATVYRLDGLMRARYDTRKESHAIGDDVFIVNKEEIVSFTDPLCGAGSEIFVKSQPSGVGGTMPLGHVPSVQAFLYGKGVVPPPIENVRLSAPYKNVKAYRTGDNMTITWSFYSNYGAGFRPAGNPQADETIKDSVFIEILSAADVVMREDTTSNSTYTYSNVNLLADFGSEPASFKVRASRIRDGWRSSTETVTIEKVS